MFNPIILFLTNIININGNIIYSLHTIRFFILFILYVLYIFSIIKYNTHNATKHTNVLTYKPTIATKDTGNRYNKTKIKQSLLFLSIMSHTLLSVYIFNKTLTKQYINYVPTKILTIFSSNK